MKLKRLVNIDSEIQKKLFDAPLNGKVTLSDTDSVNIDRLCEHIKQKLTPPWQLSCDPHRIDQFNYLSLFIEDENKERVYILITLNGRISFPNDKDYAHSPRLYISVTDAVDGVYLVGQLVERLNFEIS